MISNGVMLNLHPLLHYPYRENARKPLPQPFPAVRARVTATEAVRRAAAKAAEAKRAAVEAKGAAAEAATEATEAERAAAEASAAKRAAAERNHAKANQKFDQNLAASECRWRPESWRRGDTSEKDWRSQTSKANSQEATLGFSPADI